MAIAVVHDGTKFPEPAEPCCFCWTPSRTWHKRKDVAVCEQCAPTHKVKDIPSKETWCSAVRARLPRRFGDIEMDTITKNKFTTSVEISHRLIADQMVTALEGGCGYWLESFKPLKGQERVTKSPWYDDEEFWAKDFLVEAKVTDDEKTYQLTPESIQKGLNYLAAKQGRRVQEIIDENGDAETADVFLQACMFEDIVYG